MDNKQTETEPSQVAGQIKVKSDSAVPVICASAR